MLNQSNLRYGKEDSRFPKITLLLIKERETSLCILNYIVTVKNHVDKPGYTKCQNSIAKTDTINKHVLQKYSLPIAGVIILTIQKFTETKL